MKATIFSASVVSAILFAAGCSSPVYVQKDNSVNLNNYKTYMWVDTRASRAGSTRSSSKTAALEPLDLLKKRVEKASKHIDAAQLAISPQCGFASTMGGNPVTEADERAKLRLCVEAAAKIWNY